MDSESLVCKEGVNRLDFDFYVLLAPYNHVKQQPTHLIHPRPVRPKDLIFIEVIRSKLFSVLFFL